MTLPVPFTEAALGAALYAANAAQATPGAQAEDGVEDAEIVEEA